MAKNRPQRRRGKSSGVPSEAAQIASLRKQKKAAFEKMMKEIKPSSIPRPSGPGFGNAPDDLPPGFFSPEVGGFPAQQSQPDAAQQQQLQSAQINLEQGQSQPLTGDALMQQLLQQMTRVAENTDRMMKIMEGSG